MTVNDEFKLKTNIKAGAYPSHIKLISFSKIGEFYTVQSEFTEHHMTEKEIERMYEKEVK